MRHKELVCFICIFHKDYSNHVCVSFEPGLTDCVHVASQTHMCAAHHKLHSNPLTVGVGVISYNTSYSAHE